MRTKIEGSNDKSFVVSDEGVSDPKRFVLVQILDYGIIEGDFSISPKLTQTCISRADFKELAKIWKD